jgi:hypothetical protein
MTAATARSMRRTDHLARLFVPRVIVSGILHNFDAAKDCATVDEFWTRLSLAFEQMPEPNAAD